MPRYLLFLMFASIALGLAASLLFPGIPVAVTEAATIAGRLVTTLRAPLFAAVFTLALLQKETAAVIAMAVVASAQLTAILSLFRNRPAKVLVKAEVKN